MLYIIPLTPYINTRKWPLLDDISLPTDLLPPTLVTTPVGVWYLSVIGCSRYPSQDVIYLATPLYTLVAYISP